MELRPFLPSDRDSCLGVFDSNSLPGREAFERFLAHPGGPFFVMEHEGAVIGCGGYSAQAQEAGVAGLEWGIIRKDLQRQGLGRFLLMYRLREIGKAGGFHAVRVDTSQETAQFFEGQGFKTAGVDNGRVTMVKKLTVCA